MNALFTADWQVEWSNIDLCKKAWKFVVESCLEKKLKTIGVLGDSKQQYNPVDVRVTKFWIWAIHYAKNQGLRVFFILGNHDRVGQYTDAQNWLPIFRRTGAEAYDKPCVIPMEDGSRIFILPFMSSTAKLKQAATELLERKPDKSRDILVFHANLKNCQFNQLGQRSEGKLRAEDLHPDRYFACIGGDIHLPQKIGKNVYYTGSPFAMDWGEANQQKRFVVVTQRSERAVDVRIDFLPSPIPGWFDPTWPGFRASEVRPGSRLRLHVKCSAKKNYGRTLERARKAAERRFKGALVYTEPEFEEQESFELKIKATDSDRKKIKAYVAEAYGDEPRLVSQLSYYLTQAGVSARAGDRIKFKWAECTNFLSYKHLKVSYEEPGIVVVRAQNEDAGGGRSNGGGKTNLLQPIPVALFGRTFKGQTHDRWSRRFTKKQAIAKVCFEDARNREVLVERTRKPGSLQLHVDNVDQSSGLRGSSKDATQGMIEQVSGFSWQTLANAVYIDESVTQAFLFGTRKTRTEVLSKFQNLERFEKALKLVKQQQSKHRDLLQEAKTELAVCKATLSECKSAYSNARKTAKEEVHQAKQRWQYSVRLTETARVAWLRVKKQLENRIEKYRGAAENAGEQLSKISHRMGALVQQRQELEAKIRDYSKLDGLSKCPTCNQIIDRFEVGKHIPEWKAQLEQVIEATKKVAQDILTLRRSEAVCEGQYDKAKIELGQERRKYDAKEIQAAEARRQYHQLRSKSSIAQKTIKKYRSRLSKIKKRKLTLKKYLAELSKTEIRLQFCMEAFSRDGIPNFLNQQLAPMLNKAAEYYAQLFADGQLHVRFEVIDGEFEPRILNATGGKTLEDQSVGEKALAGLITSFALREIAPRCNLLVLDEPGDGLDEVNARQFARALPKLQKRFGQILLTSHNQTILSELSGERQIVVVKKDRVSRILPEDRSKDLDLDVQ